MTTAIDLFAGGGGAALGLRRAGVRCLAHVEWDHAAAETLRAAVAAGMLDGDVIEGDVRAVDWSPYVGVDRVWASPPCQDWSSAGKRLGASGERNGWPWTWDAVDKIRPTWLICENVTGLLHHLAVAHIRTVPGTPGLFGDGEPADVYDPTPNPERCARCYWDLVILPEARRRFTHVEYRVIDCADLGVPQRRERLILVCGPEPYRWPAMTHRDPTAVMAPGLPWVSVRQALGIGVEGIKTAHAPGERVTDRERVDLTDSPAWTVPATGGGVKGGSMVVVRSALPQSQREIRPDLPADTLGAGTRGGYRAPFLRDTLAGSESWRLDQPSSTVTATEVKGATPRDMTAPGRSPERASGALWPATGRRRLTPAECAALQSFPADWPWQGTKTAIYAQIGNACPPPLVDAIARALTAQTDAERARRRTLPRCPT